MAAFSSRRLTEFTELCGRDHALGAINYEAMRIDTRLSLAYNKQAKNIGLGGPKPLVAWVLF